MESEGTQCVALDEILHPTDLDFLDLCNGTRGIPSTARGGSWENLVRWCFERGPVLDAGHATVTKHRPVLPELPFQRDKQTGSSSAMTGIIPREKREEK